MSGKEGSSKSSMDRLGLFSESGYTTIGDAYVKGEKTKDSEASKGKGGKWKAASKNFAKDGCFSKFESLHVGVKYMDEIDVRRTLKQESKKNAPKLSMTTSSGRKVRDEFKPVSGPKSSSGSGSYYGTFRGIIPHQDTPTVEKEATEEKKYKNFLAGIPRPSGKKDEEKYVSPGPLEPQETGKVEKKEPRGIYAVKGGLSFDDYDEKKAKERGEPPKYPKKKAARASAPPKAIKPPVHGKSAEGLWFGTINPIPKYEPHYDQEKIDKKRVDEALKRREDKGPKKIFRPVPAPKSTVTRSIVAANIPKHG